MDSLTQIVLGCAVGDAVLGDKVGRRAVAWGAVCGTLPDLDFLLPIQGAIEHYSYHRSWSHSILVLTAATPVVTWVIGKTHPGTREHRRGWLWLVWLVFMTHILLDCFTVYGTQVFWPLPWAPVMWGSIFVIDPLYTLPLLAATLSALAWRKRHPRRTQIITLAGLVVSSLYLVWTCVAQAQVATRIQDHFAADGLTVTNDRVLVTPAPFQSLLWRFVVIRGDEYREGLYSLFADEYVIDNAHPRNLDQLGGLADSWPARRVAWFTSGFYAVGTIDDEVVITDLRMGVESAYAYRFAIGRHADRELHGIEPRRIETRIPDGTGVLLWRRIWDPHAVPPDWWQPR